MKFLISISLLLAQSLAFAAPDLKASFQAMEKATKGPFSKNYLQAAEGRVLVTEPLPSAWHLQFQAAYRDGAAVELAKQDFYVGNLFTTNYYELMGEAVFNDSRSSHALDPQALLAKNATVMPKAVSMVRHWALEKYYVEHFPASGLAKSFAIRGIAGSEFELVYATYFFNFYLSSLSDEFQYLPGFLLAQKSPLGNSSSLEKARNLIAAAYDQSSAKFGPSDARVKRLFGIRNMIHNQLAPTVLGELEKYMKDYPKYKEEGLSELSDVDSLLRAYFDFSAAKISSLAAKQKQAEIKALADQITKTGNTPENLLKLSTAAAALKTQLTAKKVATPTETLNLIVNISVYLNKELSAMKDVSTPATLQVALDTVYMEGYFIQDNWTYFKDEAAKAASAQAKVQLLSEALEIGTDSLTQSFTPAFDQWKSVEPKMENFLDNTIKSSALNNLSLVAGKLKGQ